MFTIDKFPYVVGLKFYIFLLNTFRFIQYYYSGNIQLFLVTYFAFHPVLLFRKYSAVPCYILCVSSSTIIQEIFCCSLLHILRIIEYYCSGNIMLFLVAYFAYHRVLLFRKYSAVPCYILCVSAWKYLCQINISALFSCFFLRIFRLDQEKFN
jgi:hypothetical protein